MKQPTISHAYLAQQTVLHQNPYYGVASLTFAPIVKELMDRFKVRSLSDYGAGKQNLRKALRELGKTDFEYFPYDRGLYSINGEPAVKHLPDGRNAHLIQKPGSW